MSAQRINLAKDRLSHKKTCHNTELTETEAWWRIHFFRGILDDIKRRLPFYVSDWTDAWDYRILPATVYMYFAKYDHLLHLPFQL